MISKEDEPMPSRLTSVTKLLLLAALVCPSYCLTSRTSPAPTSDSAWGGAGTAPLTDITQERRYGDLEPFRTENRR